MALLQEAAQPQAPAKPKRNAGQYKALVGQLLDFVYSDKGIEIISEALDAEAPAQEIVPQIVARLFQGLLESAKQAGKTMPPDMVVTAMVEVTQAVMELAVEKGVMDAREVDETGEAVFTQSANTLDQNYGQSAGQAERQGYAEIFARILGGGQ